MDFIVGTFNTLTLHTLRFTPPTSTTPASLELLADHSAIGSHSWLALSPSKSHLYCTAWTEPPSVVAYRVDRPSTGPTITYINSATIASRSGYVAVYPSGRFLYSVGGPSGEVFTIDPSDGSIGEHVQTLSFIEEETGVLDGDKRPHGDFGGLRHGAHSVDVSPDGRNVYIADIGRNCVWTYSVQISETGGKSDRLHTGATQGNHLVFGGKHVAPRSTDGPRHTTPHPSEPVLYSLQEHTSMVDAFCVDDGVTLTHVSGVKIIPTDKSPEDYWADEVRVSNRHVYKDGYPRYLYASTRGLKTGTKGYVAVIELDQDGRLGQLLDIWESPTSGGWANAVEPAPASAYQDLPKTNGNGSMEWLALTDSEEGWVFVLGFDGRKVSEIGRVKLENEGGDEMVVGAATAVWL